MVLRAPICFSPWFTWPTFNQTFFHTGTLADDTYFPDHTTFNVTIWADCRPNHILFVPPLAALALVARSGVICSASVAETFTACLLSALFPDYRPTVEPQSRYPGSCGAFKESVMVYQTSDMFDGNTAVSSYNVILYRGSSVGESLTCLLSQRGRTSPGS